MYMKVILTAFQKCPVIENVFNFSPLSAYYDFYINPKTLTFAFFWENVSTNHQHKHRVIFRHVCYLKPFSLTSLTLILKKTLWSVLYAERLPNVSLVSMTRGKLVPEGNTTVDV